MLGEGIDTGTLPESFLALLDDLGLLVGGGRPTQHPALIGQHQPGPVHPQQRLGRAGDLLHRPRQVLLRVKGAQRADILDQGGRIDGHADLLHRRGGAAARLAHKNVVVQRAVYDMGTGTQSAMRVVAMYGL